MKKVLFTLLGLSLALCVAMPTFAQKMTDEERDAAKKAAMTEQLQKLPQVKTEGISLMKTYPVASALTPSKAVIYSEDFAGVDPTAPALPAGWTTIATPGDDTDVWSAGTLYSGGGAFPGHSGTTYAYALYKETHAHDMWAFTPAISLEAGQVYTISFWVVLQGYGGAMEALDVNIGTAATVDAMTTQIYDEDAVDDVTTWRKVSYSFTPTTTGDYYIGFHSYSPADVNATFLDDIVVETPTVGPGFEGPSTLAMGTHVDINPTKTATYTINSVGSEALTVSLTSNSPELELTNVPASIAPGTSADITVTLNRNNAGDYTGNFVLATNDPANETVTVEVTATISAGTLTGYQYQQFETVPAGWLTSGFSINAGSGIDASSALRGNAWSLSSPQVITNYISLGTQPRVKFYYKALNYTGATPTEAAGVRFMVAVSTDYGQTFTNVYEVAAGGENVHVPSADYALVDVDLSDYADQVVMVGILAASASGSDYYFYIDNMEVGTPPQNDLAASSITGNATPAVGAETVYTVSVKNMGLNAATSYTVKLMQEGELELASVPGVSIASGEVKTFALAWTPQTEVATYVYGEVVFEDDEPLNNKTSNLNVAVQPAGIVSINIGTGTDNAYLPVDFYYYKSAQQTLYYANEMGTNGGTITKIGFKPSMGAAAYASTVPVRVWIAETDKTDFSDQTWLNVADMTEIHNAVVSYPAGDSEWIITLPEPYEYQGGNLVIYTVKIDAAYVTAKYFKNTTYAGSSRTLRRSVDAADLTAENPGAGTVSHQAPNVTFFMEMDGMGGISGVVSNEDGVMEGVKVAIEGTQLYAMTNAEGAYSFPNLVAGEYTLIATMFGYTDVETDITIVADETAEQNITMVSLPKVTISGTVKRADNAAVIEGAVITLTGYENFETTTGADGGYVIENVWANNEYEMTVAATGFVAHTETLAVAAADVTKDVTLNETPLPVIGLNAETIEDNSKVHLTWYAPDVPLTTYTLDDGTSENGWQANPNYGLSIGSKFVTSDAGYIDNVDLYFQNNANSTGRTMVVDIYNAEQQLVATSSLFASSGDAWVNVPVGAEFSGDFYVMVTWPLAAGSSHYLGSDENGPNAATDPTWYLSNGTWTLLHEAAQSNPAVSMIRANVLVFGESKTFGYAPETVQSNNSRRSTKHGNDFALQANNLRMDVPVVTGNPVSNSASKAFVNYSVYRLLAGEEQDETAWETLTSTLTATEYTDSEWATQASGIYRYAVKANYTNLSSVAKFSKDIEKDMYVTVTVNLTNNADAPFTGTMVMLENQDNDLGYGGMSSGSSIVTIGQVRKGTYTLTATLNDFETYTEADIVINGDTALNVNLIEMIETPFGLNVEETDSPTDRLFSWNNAPADFSDDFESYENFIIENIGEYTLIDGDGSAESYGIVDVTFPNSNYVGSWIVFDPTATTPPITGGEAHSGSKYIACFNAADPPLNNDWLILPETQIIQGTKFSFWARSYTTQYGAERIKVGVSTTGTNQADFTFISTGNYIELPAEWTEYSFDLSAYAGQKVYLAINCVSNDAFYAMVDDIFVGVDTESSKSFTEYAVYLDEVKVDVTTQTQYKFTDLTDGTHTAGVKAIYTSGESEIVYSEPFVVDGSSIDANSIAGIQLYPNPFTSEITVSNPAAVSSIEITNAAGQSIKAIAGGSKISTSELSSGVYFVIIRNMNGEKVVHKMVKK
ncbi:MAG: choice-of-anchor J domain-containing protein [Cytophagaceae bacterium]|jgi:hypothetical protein|nr:choice-of-anchor J domain-containing protein [Cytophagaceae bacterium]